MSEWLTVCEFPLGEDLAPVAEFIRRHQLPMRITEERNHQRVSCPVPQLVEPIRALLQDWRAGRVDLRNISVQVTSAADREMDREAESHRQENPQADAPSETVLPPPPQPSSVIPDWPLRETPVCLILIALCFIGWFLLRQNLAEAMVIIPQGPGDFDLSGSSLSWHLSQGEFWRLWTPAIIHFSLPHALFNALGVWILGRSLEARAGSIWFALLVLLSAPAANLAQYVTAPQTLFGGMSGVVYALVGAVFVIQRWQPGWTEVPRSIVWLAVAWLVVCMTGLVDYFMPGGIANAAHLGGFVAGLLLGLLFCLAGGARRYFSSDNSATF